MAKRKAANSARTSTQAYWVIPKISVTCRLDAKLVEGTKKAARMEKISVTAFVTQALTNHLRKVLNKYENASEDKW